MLYYLDEEGNPGPEVSGGFYIVSRRKLAGPGTHYGVLATSVRWGSPDEIFHMTDKGYAVVSVEDFCRGHQITLHEGVPPTEANLVLQRAAALRKWKPAYDILAHNCEHAARFLVSGERKSEQVSGLVGLGVLALVLIFLSQ